MTAGHLGFFTAFKVDSVLVLVRHLEIGQDDIFGTRKVHAPGTRSVELERIDLDILTGIETDQHGPGGEIATGRAGSRHGLLVRRKASVDGSGPGQGDVRCVLRVDQAFIQILGIIRGNARVRSVILEMGRADDFSLGLDVQGNVAFQVEGSDEIASGGKIHNSSPLIGTIVDRVLDRQGIKGYSITLGALVTNIPRRGGIIGPYGRIRSTTGD
jgi:hypothetical protein